MHSFVRAFLNCACCVDFESVKRTTNVVIECNSKLFLALTICYFVGGGGICSATLIKEGQSNIRSTSVLPDRVHISILLCVCVCA